MSPVFFVITCCIGLFACAETTLNNRPIIGILAQEMRPWSNDNNRGPNRESYIAASYVKFMEGSGARVVPIMINRNASYYENIVNNVNGILLPGGGTYFNVTEGYAEAGGILFRLALEKNKAGIYFPVWGTCLGFELLTFLAAEGVEHRARCLSYNDALPLFFRPSMFQSRLFGSMPYDLIGILAKEPVTANFHRWCLTESNMTALNLDAEWRFMTVNQDAYGLEFISTLEHKVHPLYGVQFHPEKNNYEWKEGKNHPHSAEAVRISQYFGNFFVNEARRNHQRFPREEEERQHLIYNYPAKYTGKDSFFEQSYIFDESS